MLLFSLLTFAHTDVHQEKANHGLVTFEIDANGIMKVGAADFHHHHE